MSLEKINKYRDIGIEKILADKTLSAEFGTFYFQLTGDKICVGCSGKMRQKFTNLMNTNQQKLKTMSNKKFIMVPGKLIDRSMAPTGLSGQYTASNMTDEIALQLLKSQKGYIKFFKDFPDNWEKLAAKAKFPVAPSAPAKKPVTNDEVDSKDSTDSAEGSAEGSNGTSNEGSTDDRADAIEAINSTEGKSSTDMNAKEVIALLERIDQKPIIEQFTAGEKDLENKRKTVLKAVKKRLRQLSE